MGGVNGSVGNGFQNQDQLTPPSTGGATADSSIINHPRMDASPAYAGDDPIRDPIVGQYMYVPIPQYFSCAPVVPSTKSEWRNGEFYGVMPVDGLVVGCFAVDVDTASSSVDLYFVQDDTRLGTDTVKTTLIKTLDEFSTDDDATTSLYHRGIFAGARRQNLYDGAITDPITGVNQGSKIFTVAGDRTAVYFVGQTIDVVNSTGNNGPYTPNNIALNAGNTEITVDEAIPDPTVDGDIETIGVIRYEQKDTTGQNVDGELYLAGGISSTIVPHVDGHWNGSAAQTSSYYQIRNTRLHIGVYQNRQYLQSYGGDTTLIGTTETAWGQLEVLSMDQQPPSTVCFRWAGDSDRDGIEVRYKLPDGTWYKGVITADSTAADNEADPALITMTHDSTDFEMVSHFGNGTSDLQLTNTFTLSAALP